MTISVRELYEFQIALRLDEYKYDKDSQEYFETMPVIGLVDSQVMLINDYMDILINRNTTRIADFRKMLMDLERDDSKYQELLAAGSKSTTVKKRSMQTAYLLRQIKKYDHKFN